MYCNYSRDKFGNELTFIIPNWLDLTSSDNEIHIDGNEDEYCYPEDVYTLNFLYTLRYAERAYLDLVEQWDKRVPDKRYKSGYRNNPWKPQEARAVLPNSLKTELVMTGFISDWWGKTNIIKNEVVIKSISNSDPNLEEEISKCPSNCKISRNGFFGLRCASSAHPQAQELAIPLREEFIKRNYLN